MIHFTNVFGMWMMMMMMMMMMMTTMTSCFMNFNIHLFRLVKSSPRLFSEAEKLFLDGDEEGSYLLYMRFLTLIQTVKKSSEYKKDVVWIGSSLTF
jgi:hypothetical protein